MHCNTDLEKYTWCQQFYILLQQQHAAYSPFSIVWYTVTVFNYDIFVLDIVSIVKLLLINFHL